jgi:uncharacterized Zn finger protein
MPQLDIRKHPKAACTVRNDCPECGADLALMRVMGGRRTEYWTMRCVRCGTIHLNIIETPAHPTTH